jgi:hypothetical protein
MRNCRRKVIANIGCGRITVRFLNGAKPNNNNIIDQATNWSKLLLTKNMIKNKNVVVK